MKPDESPPVVLVVEDEPLLQILATEGLEDAGFEVLAASNADEALRVLEERAESVQVLFTDVRMPGSMDGMALAQAVHRRWPHILLVLSSGHARPSEDDLPDHGRFVPKPYTTAAIVRQIQELMTR